LQKQVQAEHHFQFDALTEIMNYSRQLGVPKESILFKSTLARGLDYYTGMIFEVSLPGYEGGSCGGGGRYDKLIGQLGGISVPAVGIAFGFDRLVQSIRDHQHLKGRNVVITIDDGYEDNFKYAYPVLKKFGFPAIIFLATNFIGNDKKFLSWEEVATMSKGGVSFGAHTKTHLYLGNINDEKLIRDEIEGSKRAIEGKLGIPVDYFCYPNGGFNERVKELVVKAGYKGACTTNRGFADFNNDVYELKRIKVTNADMANPFSFWLKLSGYYNILRKDKNPN